ncbi:hypothetical protein OsccyDRAFT_4105 [Leptolyngbyaceae cyanobacterium JSC-12]|nr:hypothetical protein OsccyDRAFT_4105 [Leptolyngbyaceae cyanobacterium JSC-12]
MSWKEGHRLICVRDNTPRENSAANLLRAYVKEQNKGWVTVVCPNTWIVVSRYQEQFEKDGWQLEESREFETTSSSGSGNFSNN